MAKAGGGMLAGMALMAGLAIALRARGADPRLAPALGRLAVFCALLAAVLALDEGRFEAWQMLILAPLPILLAQHVEALAAPSRWRRDEIALAASGALCLPFLLLPAPVQAAMAAGRLPDLDSRVLLVTLAGVGLCWLALIAATALSGLRLLRALRRHRTALAQIIAAPPPRLPGGVVILGGFLALVFGLQLADLVSLGGVLPGPWGDLFILALILGTGLQGLTLRLAWPDWAEEVVAPAAPYARSGLDAQAMAQLLVRLDAAMQRDCLWRAPGLSLADLATAARAKPFYVSQSLNQGRGETFFDYVNRWRVAEAQNLLRSSEATVLDIAMATGFNAKSTFNAAFRKVTGMTPSQWRKDGAP